jgi:sensor histidine kinase YesM
MVDSVSLSFNDFMMTSLRFDEVFLADNVDTGEWFFGTLQPSYNKFRQDIAVLNEMIHQELTNNSADFDAGFYRSIMPGVVSVGAGLLLVFLLFFFTMVNYVRPIYRISDGIENYQKTGRKYGYTFDGDDQLANINSGVTDLIEENIELKMRVRALKEDRTK